MTVAIQTSPDTGVLFPGVVVDLVGDRQDELTLIARVTAALERAGHSDGATAFAALARSGMLTEQDLLDLIHGVVTAI